MFGSRLKLAREAAGLTGNQLAMRCEVPQGTLSALERGVRPPSEANIEALAAARDLRVTLDQLKAWAALDAAGEEGLALIREHAPEALSEPPPVPGLSRKELRLLDAIRELADGDLDSVDMGPASYVWQLDPAARLRHLLLAVQELGEEEASGGLAKEN